jgi:hypothetical protein
VNYLKDTRQEMHWVSQGREIASEAGSSKDE